MRILRLAILCLFAVSLLSGADQKDVRLEIGGPRVVYGAGNGTGQLLTLSDGSLLLAGLEFSLRSTDSGTTWYTQPGIRGLIVPLRSGAVYIMNGATDYYLSEGRTRPGGKPGVFLGDGMQLNSEQELFSASKPGWEEISFTLEKAAPFTDDTGALLGSPFIAGPIVELTNRSLLALTYGKFVGDTVPIPGLTPTKGERWFKSRTYAISSTDGGKTWKYLTTVAYDGKTGQESFTEPAMVHLGNDELLVVMRTGRFAPLHMTRSKDGGKTWAKPESLRTLGLSPQLTTLSGGTVVLSYGWRPFRDEPMYRGALEDYKQRYRTEVGLEDPSTGAGDYVMVSFDKGRTWSKPQKTAEPITVGYTRLAPTGRDSFLVMAQRITVPGVDHSTLMRMWRNDWTENGKKSKRSFVSRHITISR